MIAEKPTTYTESLLQTLKVTKSSMTPGSDGKVFSGILQGADVMPFASGYLFGSEDYPDGTYMDTAEIVATGRHPALGCFVETSDQKRYVIADVDYNTNLPDRTASVEAAIESNQSHIEQNAKYFSARRWS